MRARRRAVQERQWCGQWLSALRQWYGPAAVRALCCAHAGGAWSWPTRPAHPRVTHLIDDSVEGRAFEVPRLARALPPWWVARHHPRLAGAQLPATCGRKGGWWGWGCDAPSRWGVALPLQAAARVLRLPPWAPCSPTSQPSRQPAAAESQPLPPTQRSGPHARLKFSAARGDTSVKSTASMRPSGCPCSSTSRYTSWVGGWGWRAEGERKRVEGEGGMGSTCRQHVRPLLLPPTKPLKSALNWRPVMLLPAAGTRPRLAAPPCPAASSQHPPAGSRCRAGGRGSASHSPPARRPAVSPPRAPPRCTAPPTPSRILGCMAGSKGGVWSKQQGNSSGVLPTRQHLPAAAHPCAAPTAACSWHPPLARRPRGAVGCRWSVCFSQHSLCCLPAGQPPGAPQYTQMLQRGAMSCARAAAVRRQGWMCYMHGRPVVHAAALRQPAGTSALPKPRQPPSSTWQAEQQASAVSL